MNTDASFDDEALERIGHVWDAMEKTGLARLQRMLDELRESSADD